MHHSVNVGAFDGI